MKNILKTDSIESVIEFIKTVETENSEKISRMVTYDIEMYFDIDRTLQKLKKNYSEISDEVDDVKCLILEIHKDLLDLEIQNINHMKEIQEMFDDSRLIYHVLKENLN